MREGGREGERERIITSCESAGGRACVRSHTPATLTGITY